MLYKTLLHELVLHLFGCLFIARQYLFTDRKRPKQFRRDPFSCQIWMEHAEYYENIVNRFKQLRDDRKYGELLLNVDLMNLKQKYGTFINENKNNSDSSSSSNSDISNEKKKDGTTNVSNDSISNSIDNSISHTNTQVSANTNKNNLSDSSKYCPKLINWLF